MRIMTGELRSGEFIRLDETAADFGCSVTPVREALMMLRSEGLVHSFAHRGFAVENLSRRDIVDIFWLQSELSARLAMRAPGSEHLTESLPKLEQIIDRLETAVQAGDSETVATAEFEFHRGVYRLAESPKTAWFLVSVARYSPFELYAGDAEWGELAVASHRRLISALRADDKPAIHAEIKTAFADARERLLAQLTAAGFWDEQPD